MADTESIERILGDEERGPGIKKQVEISVISDNMSAEQELRFS
jgi:hypothetical protein